MLNVSGIEITVRNAGRASVKSSQLMARSVPIIMAPTIMRAADVA